MQHCLRCFAGSLLALCLLLPGGSLGHGSAGNARKNGKPRPIKMGEFLRSAYAKRLVNLSQVHLRTKTLHMHQWGVNLPGACEALVPQARHD